MDPVRIALPAPGATPAAHPCAQKAQHAPMEPTTASQNQVISVNVLTDLRASLGTGALHFAFTVRWGLTSRCA